MKIIWNTVLLIGCVACGRSESSLFTEVSQSAGVHFVNQLAYTEDFNPYTYRNFFNGGGVALGDVNNDGLLDVYFTGNLVDNKLFLNKGNWQFEDVTAKAGVASPDVWSSGATFVDINGDGWLDLYVCKSGKPGGTNRHNELFINNGDLTFTEKSKAYGLDINGLSTHSAFFDYDRDGDLDAYILTNSIRSIGGFDLIPDQRMKPDEDGGGNKLMRNEGGKFVDYTLEAGIYTSKIGFGLGITLSDFNTDGWTDIFISNDFFEKDYLYLNDRQGGFTEVSDQFFESTSMGSMGADAADLDGDGFSDIVVTEMLPATIARARSKTVFDTWDRHVLAMENGYGYQQPRNVLHRSLIGGRFQEIGRYAGLSATEWSWGALILDMDNDGKRDVFVSNGILKDLLDRDYLVYTANDETFRAIAKSKDQLITQLIDKMPGSPVPNFAFRQTNELSFTNKAAEWGLAEPSFSNGSAYGDLDNDGDLDLVVNNVNMRAFVYRNNTDTSIHRSIQVMLQGAEANTAGVGAKVIAHAGKNQWVAENFPSRGFESAVDPRVHIGLGTVYKLDSLTVIWPNQQTETRYGVSTGQMLTFRQNDASGFFQPEVRQPLGQINTVEFAHRENEFVDFDRDRLLPLMLDNEGPCLASGDINGDGWEDFFVGGARGQAGMFWLGGPTGWRAWRLPALEVDAISEDVAAVLADVNGDGLLDLYVASGGRSFSSSSSALHDRLYLNIGQGQFEKTPDLPFDRPVSTGAVAAGDMDGDGDVDFFVGERYHPFFYGRQVRGYLFENQGDGAFRDVTEDWAAAMLQMPMITDAKWQDLNDDGHLDLIVSSEWGSISLWISDGTVLTSQPELLVGGSTGWWQRIQVVDFDGDGDLDVIAGNHGRNSFFEGGMRMYVGDFDQNSTPEQIICYKRGNRYFPIADRDELVKQLPGLKKHILYFRDYAEMDVNQLLGAALQKAEVLDAEVMESSVFLQQERKWIRQALPWQLQLSTIYAISTGDLNADGFPDLAFGGNLYQVKPQFGRQDALPLTLWWGSKNGFSEDSIVGTKLFGPVRDLKVMGSGMKGNIVVGLNNENVRIYRHEK